MVCCVYPNKGSMQQSHDTVVFRVTFKPDSAADFLNEEDVAMGRLVQEHDTYTMDEAADFVNEFASCLDDARALHDGNKVVDLLELVDKQ